MKIFIKNFSQYRFQRNSFQNEQVQMKGKEDESE